jgi:hypothetical protein
VGANNGLSIDKLKSLYSGIVLAHGAISEKLLGLKNETTMKKVFSSRQIVNWYNGALDSDLTN